METPPVVVHDTVFCISYTGTNGKKHWYGNGTVPSEVQHSVIYLMNLAAVSEVHVKKEKIGGDKTTCRVA